MFILLAAVLAPSANASGNDVCETPMTQVGLEESVRANLFIRDLTDDWKRRHDSQQPLGLPVRMHASCLPQEMRVPVGAEEALFQRSMDGAPRLVGYVDQRGEKISR